MGCLQTSDILFSVINYLLVHAILILIDFEYCSYHCYHFMMMMMNPIVLPISHSAKASSFMESLVSLV